MKKLNRKNKETYAFMGFRNLGFKEIQTTLLNYLVSTPHEGVEALEPLLHSNTSTGKTLNSNTSNSNTSIGNTSIGNTPKVIPLNPISQSNNIPTEERLEQPITTSTGKSIRRIPIIPISLAEYARRQERLAQPHTTSTDNPNSAYKDGGLGSKPHSTTTEGTDGIATQIAKVPRHSSNSIGTASPNSKPSIDPMDVWIIMYMIHLILTKPKKWEKGEFLHDEWTGISHEELIEVFKSTRKIRRAKDLATASGILLRTDHVPNLYVDKFMLNLEKYPSTSLGLPMQHPCLHFKTNKLLIDARERRNSKDNMDDVTQYSIRVMKDLRIRKKEAFKLIKSSFEAECAELKTQNKLTNYKLNNLETKRAREQAYVLMVDDIRNHAYAKRDDFGHRLHTLFTQSPKKLRPFLYFKGIKQDLFILDLGNAQPLLLNLIIMNHYEQKKWFTDHFTIKNIPTFLQLLMGIGNNKDVVNYITWTQKGQLYEQMHRLLIKYKYREVSTLFESCKTYINKTDHTKDETIKLIALIHSSLKPLRALLKLDEDNELTQRVLKHLFKVRKQNLNDPSIIDNKFITELQNAVFRAYHCDMSDDVKKKIKTQLCKHVFYGMLYGQTKKVKNPAKKLVAKDIKKKKPYSVLITKVFRESFPNVWSIIEQVKQHDYTTLAQKLQHQEVTIIVDHILRDLIVKEKRKFFLSIHDGILCTADDLELLMQRIIKEFDKWKMEVPLNIDNVTTGESSKVILNEQDDVFKGRSFDVEKDGKMITVRKRVA